MPSCQLFLAQKPDPVKIAKRKEESEKKQGGEREKVSITGLAYLHLLIFITSYHVASFINPCLLLCITSSVNLSFCHCIAFGNLTLPNKANQDQALAFQLHSFKRFLIPLSLLFSSLPFSHCGILVGLPVLIHAKRLFTIHHIQNIDLRLHDNFIEFFVKDLLYKFPPIRRILLFFTWWTRC